MSIRVRLIVLTSLALAVTMAFWGWMHLKALDRILLEQHARRLSGLAETVSHFYTYFPTTEGISALDNALRDHLILDSRLARLDIISLEDGRIDHIAGASRIDFDWPERTLRTASSRFQIHNVVVETDKGPAVGILYPVTALRGVNTYVGVLSYSRFYSDILSRSRQLLLLSSLALIAAIIVIVAIGYRWLVDKPLSLITETIGNIEKGNYVERIPAMKKDELGMLAEQFNAMASQIERTMTNNRDLNATLEQRVKEATGRVVQLQVELNQLQKLSTLGYLAAYIAHDMGTPLHSIAGLARLLLEEKNLSKDARHKLELIVQQTERLDLSITNVRKATRLPEPIFEKLGLSELLHETKTLIEPLVRQEKIHLIIDAVTDSIFIYGDRHRIQTALFNLIDNSREAMVAGGEIRIRIEEEAVSGTVTVAVEDNGPGISAENRERVMKPFFSTHGGEKLRGLGLSIVTDIMKMHQGSFSIASEPGGGTKAEMHFPRHLHAASTSRSRKTAS